MSNSKRSHFLRYVSIIQILKVRPLTFNEILSSLHKRFSYDSTFKYSKRTFQRDKIDIHEIFDIEIKVIPGYKYKIALEETARHSRLSETFDYLDLLYRSRTSSATVLFEQRQSIGNPNWNDLIHAIHSKLQVSFRHEKYWTDDVQYKTVYPLALKENQFRWYLVAVDSKSNKIKSYGTDRITDLRIERMNFKYDQIPDLKELYKDSFGVITEGKTESVELSFDRDQAKYLGSLKLHHSQEELSSPPDEYRIRLKIKITYDFVKEIMSYGDAVEVLKPERLRKQIKDNFKNALRYYK